MLKICQWIKLKILNSWWAPLWNYVWNAGSTDHVDRIEDWDPIERRPSPEMLALYERLYSAENQARENFSVRLQIPLAIAVSLLTAQGFLFFTSDPAASKMYGAFIVVLAMAFIAVFFAGIVFFRISSGHRYQYLPTPHELETFRAECEMHYMDEPGAGRYLDQWIESAMGGEILRHYVVCASVNATLNSERSQAVYGVHRVLLLSIFLTVSAFLLFALGDLKEKPLRAPTPWRTTCTRR